MSGKRMLGDDWAGTRWAREPHIRVGDPCFNCGTPLVPASRRWFAWSIPPGYRKHAGLGLCGSCAHKFRAAGLNHADKVQAVSL